MLSIFNQFRRIVNDDGRNDRNFAVEETTLKEAHDNLQNAINAFSEAARKLYEAATENKRNLH